MNPETVAAALRQRAAQLRERQARQEQMVRHAEAEAYAERNSSGHRRAMDDAAHYRSEAQGFGALAATLEAQAGEVELEAQL